jgi:hypothetical protein
MDAFGSIQANLLSPMVLAFVLGAVARTVRSDLRFPDAVSAILSIYLLFAIGLKGGAELSKASLDDFWAPCLATLVLGVVTPLTAFAALRWLGRFDVVNAAALAAHYGSVSAVTFTASITFLESMGAPVERFLPALVAILEVPAIVIALLLARRSLGQGSWRHALHEVATGKSVVLLAGGLGIGYLAGGEGVAQVAPFFIDPFRGVLTLFLLDLGTLAAERFGELRRVGPFLLAFGVVAPLAHGVAGVALGELAGLSLGGATVLGVLAASASYIAAPAAVRAALPDANPGYYLTASLAITFPFNLAIGIPVYYAAARWLFGVTG